MHISWSGASIPVPKRCHETMQIKIDHVKSTKLCRFQP